MAFNFNKLFPNTIKKRQQEGEDALLYIFIVEMGMDYETFINTPLPILLRLLRVYEKIKKEEMRATKRKK